MTNSSLVSKRANEAVELIKSQTASLAMHGINAEQYSNVVREMLLTQPAVANTTPQSFATAVRRCCQDGLLPDGREAAIIPYKDREGNYHARYMPMRDGLCRLIAEGLGATIQSGVIYDTDETEIIQAGGVDPIIEVKRDFNKPKGILVGAWCYIKPKKHPGVLTVFDRADIDKAKAASYARSGPWVQWEDRMAEKSVIKSAANKLRYLIPRDTIGRYGQGILQDPSGHHKDIHLHNMNAAAGAGVRLSSALDNDQEYDSGEVYDAGFEPDTSEDTPTPKKRKPGRPKKMPAQKKAAQKAKTAKKETAKAVPKINVKPKQEQTEVEKESQAGNTLPFDADKPQSSGDDFDNWLGKV